MDQRLIIQLAIAWTLVGAFVFTVATTCLSLVGIVKFAERAQQRKLFYILIFELVTICVTFFGGYLNFSPKAATQSVQQQSVYDYWRSVRKQSIASIDKPDSFPPLFKYQVNGLTGFFRYDGISNVFVETNSSPSTPIFYFRPVRFENNALFVFDDSRNYTIKLPMTSGISYLSADGPNGHFAPFYNVEAQL